MELPVAYVVTCGAKRTIGRATQREMEREIGKLIREIQGPCKHGKKYDDKSDDTSLS